MSDKQPKRKYLMRLTKHVEFTTLVWARDRDEAVKVAEKDFPYLAGTGELASSSRSAECLEDLSEDPCYSKDEAYDIDSGEWTSEQPEEAEQ